MADIITPDEIELDEPQGKCNCRYCNRPFYGNPKSDQICFDCWLAEHYSDDKEFDVPGPLQGAAGFSYFQIPATIIEVSKEDLIDYIKGLPKNVRDMWWDIVHNSATPPINGIKVVQGFQAYHISRGWADIGYHLVITPDGKMYLCRNWIYQGAHAHAQGNRGSLGVCWVGNFSGGGGIPTPEQIATYSWFCQTVKEMLNIIQHTGHRWADYHPTSCPGTNLTLGMIREWANAKPIPPIIEEEEMILYQGKGTEFTFEDCYVDKNKYWLHTRGESMNVTFTLLSHRTGEEKTTNGQAVKGHQDHPMDDVAATLGIVGSYSLICNAASSINWGLREVPRK